MTTPKVLTTHQAGARWYINPATGDKVPGVTSIINMLPKPFLKPWGEKLVATEAVTNWDAVRIIKQNSGDDAAIDYLKGAARRYTKKAADLGSAAHGTFEALAKGDPLGAVTPEVVPFVRQFSNFLETVEPEYLLAEEAVWSDTHSYAGSFDAIAKIDGEVVVCDYKTSKDAHAETALQLSAYAHADFVLAANGEHIDLPKVTRGLILHISNANPNKWSLYEVPIGDEVFSYFLSLRNTFKWSQIERTVLGKPILQGAA